MKGILKIKNENTKLLVKNAIQLGIGTLTGYVCAKSVDQVVDSMINEPETEAGKMALNVGKIITSIAISAPIADKITSKIIPMLIDDTKYITNKIEIVDEGKIEIYKKK